MMIIINGLIVGNTPVSNNEYNFNNLKILYKILEIINTCQNIKLGKQSELGFYFQKLNNIFNQNIPIDTITNLINKNFDITGYYAYSALELFRNQNKIINYSKSNVYDLDDQFNTNTHILGQIPLPQTLGERTKARLELSKQRLGRHANTIKQKLGTAASAISNATKRLGNKTRKAFENSL